MTTVLCLIVMVSLFVGGILCQKKAAAEIIYRDGFTYARITKDIKKRINGISYHKNKYISYNDLRYVKVKYYNYKGKEKTGELIVNKTIVKDVVAIFYELYNIKYPIKQIKLVDEYGADDNESMAADNTSCFNYRVIAGSKSALSMHALGLAIDVNPKVNPCVGGAHGIVPANGKIYSERDGKKCKGKYSEYMIHKNDRVYKIFKKYGFSWGGDWKNMKDYQHFYKVTEKYSKIDKYEW